MEELYPVPEPDTTSIQDTTVTFAGDIQPFIKSTCAISSGCHASGASGVPVLESYSEISSNADRIKVRAITEKSMPPSGNTQPTSKQLEDFQTWLDDNKPNN